MEEDKLGDVPAPVGTIAMLFTDIEGSTSMATRLGERWCDVLEAHHAIVSDAITSEGGFIDGSEGDSFFATFTDPAQALRAAVSAGVGRERRTRTGGREARRSQARGGVRRRRGAALRRHPARRSRHGARGSFRRARALCAVPRERGARRRRPSGVFRPLGSANALGALGRDEDALEVHALARSQAEDVGSRAAQLGEHLLGDSWVRAAMERLAPEVEAAARIRGRDVPPGQRVARACALARAAVAA